MKCMPVVITILLAGYLLLSCSKGNNDEGNDPGENGNDPSCNASKVDAENMMIFPADHPLNLDVSQLPVDPFNDSIVNRLGNAGVKADFGSGLWDGAPIGIPFVVVCSTQPKMSVTFRGNAYDDNYGDESDPGPYPIPLSAPMEGNGEGDSHVIAVDKDNGMLYELYNASKKANGWEASSGAVFDLKTKKYRTEGWTSGDAAGLPIFAGLVRYDEVAKGIIDHAIRFTLAKSHIKPGYIFPARHKVNSTGGVYGLPFGARLRLKANYNITGFPARVQTILKAMKKHGLILADVGSNMYITGAPDERWSNSELQQLGKVKPTDFEVIKFNN